MRKSVWKKIIAVGLIGGSFLFQAPTCTEQAVFTTAVSSAITAGGVLYIVDRIVNE